MSLAWEAACGREHTSWNNSCRHIGSMSLQRGIATLELIRGLSSEGVEMLKEIVKASEAKVLQGSIF
eukprot:1681881-Amphidinium_carterae.1